LYGVCGMVLFAFVDILRLLWLGKKQR